jgi:protein TonB
MLRALTYLVSFGVHGLLAYVSLWSNLLPTSSVAFEQGTGNDQFVIEQGIGIEGFMQEGEAVETVEANETPTQMSEARPQIDEVKPVEQAETPPDAQIKDSEILESKEGPQAEALPEEEPKPLEKVQQQPPQMATLEQLDEQQVVEEQKAAGQKQEGAADAGVRRAYLGKLSKKLQTMKVNPHSRATGTVMIRFEVAPSGALLSREVIASSGSQLLDNAALAAVDKAAPFPPFPETLKADKIVEVVPYRFTVR